MMPHAKDQLEVIIELHAAHARHAVDRDFAKVCSLVVELATELLHERGKIFYVEQKAIIEFTSAEMEVVCMAALEMEMKMNHEISAKLRKILEMSESSLPRKGFILTKRPGD